MYNIANHYENIYHYLKTIITDPRVVYLHPFGATQPENIEIIRTDPGDADLSPIIFLKRGPLFIFYDQEPLNFNYNKKVFDYIVANYQGPYVLVSTEQHSQEKDQICKHYNFASIDYFFHIFAAADWFRGNTYMSTLTPPRSRTIEKTYITFNRLTSNDRIYRSLLINELYTNNLLDHGYVSYSQECPDGGNFADNLIAGIKNYQLDTNLVKSAISNINQLPELRIDFAQEDYIPNQSMLLSPINELMKSFIFLVTETCFWQNKTHLTEKIFKPIVLRMPFILVGCVSNLEYLRQYGFKTFSDYWDESYDSITDPIKRLQTIVKVLTTINQLSKLEQKDMLLDMLPILNHNYKLFNNNKFVKNEWQHLTSELCNISQLYKFEKPYRFDPVLKQAIPVTV